MLGEPVVVGILAVALGFAGKLLVLANERRGLDLHGVLPEAPLPLALHLLQHQPDLLEGLEFHEEGFEARDERGFEVEEGLELVEVPELVGEGLQPAQGVVAVAVDLGGMRGGLVVSLRRCDRIHPPLQILPERLQLSSVEEVAAFASLPKVLGLHPKLVQQPLLLDQGGRLHLLDPQVELLQPLHLQQITRITRNPLLNVLTLPVNPYEIVRTLDHSSQHAQVGIQRTQQHLSVLSDLGGDGGQHPFLVLPEGRDYLLFELELGEVAQHEVLPVVQLALAGSYPRLHLVDLLADLLEVEGGVRAFS